MYYDMIITLISEDEVTIIGTGGQSLPLDPENFLNMGTSEYRVWSEKRSQFFAKFLSRESETISVFFAKSRSRESETKS